jgi:AcrR family transcriptional regulator
MPSAYVDPPGRSLRSDARQNRERILAAAQEAFCELGIDASVEEIAARAGVGIGTLYRRFSTKDALIDAVFEKHLDQLAQTARRALEATDAWDALLEYLSCVVRLQAADRGFSEIIGVHQHSEQLVARARGRLRPHVERLIVRAQEAGKLRPDIVYEDVSVLLWTTGRVVDATREVEPEFWQRYLALIVDGLRSQHANPLPRPPLTTTRHLQAMRHLTQHSNRGPRD